MDNTEFIDLISTNARKTSRIRVQSNFSGAAIVNITDDILNHIGKIIKLIQTRLDQGYFCQKGKYLTIYNFQRLFFSQENAYYSLDMLIEPSEELQTLQLVINSNTGEVMNNTKALLQSEEVDLEDLEDEPEPESYGNYQEYYAPCCFLAVRNYRSLGDLKKLFDGELDVSETLQKSKVFHTLNQAQDYLSKKSELGRYIFELACGQEEISIAKQRLSDYIVKIINYNNKTVTFTTNIHAAEKEHDFEITHLHKTSTSAEGPSIAKIGCSP